MAKRICPICDHPMRGRFYCKECRSFVRHPYIMNVDYYLNERHPVKEGDCEYHQPSFMDRAAPNRPGRQNQSGASNRPGRQNRSGVSNRPGRQNRSGPMPDSRQYTQMFGRQGQGTVMNNRSGNGLSGGRNSNVGMIVAAVVVIIFILNLILPLMMFIM